MIFKEKIIPIIVTLILGAIFIYCVYSQHYVLAVGAALLTFIFTLWYENIAF